MSTRLTLKNHWQELRLFSRRMMVAVAVILLLVAILLVRLAYLQIYHTFARKQRQRCAHCTQSWADF
jgi:hypothetical protein